MSSTTSREDAPSESSDAIGGLLEHGLRAAFATGVERATPAGAPRSTGGGDTLSEEGTAAGGAAPVTLGVARYAVLAEVGRGGGGIVLKAFDTVLGREVAIKLVRGGHARSAHILQRLVTEARITGRLQHPGIVPVYEMGRTPDGLPYFAMKLVEGRTLADLLAARASPASERRRFLAIFEHIAQTLAYAHARRVIHRDLKPANVMIGAFGEVQVMDWGLAKRLDEAGEDPAAAEVAAPGAAGDPADGFRSEPGAVMGTPAYMAPEQARGRIGEIDERSDVFGLGGVLCEILTGFPPFEGETREEIHRKAASGRVDEALARLAVCGADPELLRLARRCLAPARDERPHDAAVVAAELGAYFASTEERARAAELDAVAANASARHERRSRRLSQALGASVLAAVLLVGGALWMFDRSRASQRREAAAAIEGALSAALVSCSSANASGGRQGWEDATVQVHKAEELARLAQVDDALRERVAAVAAYVKAEREEAEERERRAVQVRELVDRLATARLRTRDWDAQYREFVDAFGAAGVEIETVGADEAAARFRDAGDAAVEIARGIDSFAAASLRRTPRDRTGFVRGLELAAVVDPDPVRARIRDVLSVHGDLRTLADELPVADLPVETLEFLGNELAADESPERGLEILGIGERQRPDYFWIRAALGARAIGRGPERAEQAKDSLLGAVALRPRIAALWGNLGVAFNALGRQEEAEWAERRALELDPSDARIHHNLGAVFWARQDFAGALACYREAVRLAPDLVESHIELSRVCARLEDPAGELDALQRGLELNPGDGRLHFTLGNLYRRRGEMREAAAAFRLAAATPSCTVTAMTNLGSCLQALRDPEGAIDAYRKALAAGPAQLLPLLSLADLLGTQERWEEAGELVASGAERHAKDGRFRVLRGSFHEAAHDLAAAGSEYRECVRLLPRYAPGHLRLAGVLRLQGRFRDAREALLRGLALGDSVEALRGSPESAKAAADRRVRIETQVPELARGEAVALRGEDVLDAARACAAAGHAAAALALYGRVFDDDPERVRDPASGGRFPAIALALAEAARVEAAAEGVAASTAAAAFRDHARQWLADELEDWEARIDADPRRAQRFRPTLARWCREPALSAALDAAAGAPDAASAPAPDATAWRALRAQAESLRARGR